MRGNAPPRPLPQHVRYERERVIYLMPRNVLLLSFYIYEGFDIYRAPLIRLLCSPFTLTPVGLDSRPCPVAVQRPNPVGPPSLVPIYSSRTQPCPRDNLSMPTPSNTEHAFSITFSHRAHHCVRQRRVTACRTRVGDRHTHIAGCRDLGRQKP